MHNVRPYVYSMPWVRIGMLGLGEDRDVRVKKSLKDMSAMIEQV